MNERSPTIFISAAETSGDAHAARLIHALRDRLGEPRFVGAGGPQMAAAGCEPAVAGLDDLTAGASMLGRPLLRLGYYYRIIRRLQKAIGRIRPDLYVPVDSPALNWHLASAARKAGAKVVYYICPQAWAWAPWRVKKLSRLTDHVACILPFEQPWLRRRGVAATYVAHPLFDDLPPRAEQMPDIVRAWAEGSWRVALLAGSRPAEITDHSRALASVAAAIRKRWPASRCTFAAPDENAARRIRNSLGPAGGDEIVAGRTPQVLADSHFAVTVSGTITLEIAHFGVPMVVFYRVGRLTSLLARGLVTTPQLSLVNILAGRKIVPELMPWHGNVRRLISSVLEAMSDLGYLMETREALVELVDPLRARPPASASGNAAELIASVLHRGRWSN